MTCLDILSDVQNPPALDVCSDCGYSDEGLDFLTILLISVALDRLNKEAIHKKRLQEKAKEKEDSINFVRIKFRKYYHSNFFQLFISIIILGSFASELFWSETLPAEDSSTQQLLDALDVTFTCIFAVRGRLTPYSLVLCMDSSTRTSNSIVNNPLHHRTARVGHQLLHQWPDLLLVRQLERL